MFIPGKMEKFLLPRHRKIKICRGKNMRGRTAGNALSCLMSARKSGCLRNPPFLRYNRIAAETLRTMSAPRSAKWYAASGTDPQLRTLSKHFPETFRSASGKSGRNDRHVNEVPMDIRVLRSFLAIAREGGITKAANFLHVTQPTLSRQIQDLEAELDVRLFERHSHSMTLTPAGERLRSRAEEILELVGQTEAEFAARSRTISGDVHVGCGETPVMRHLIDAMNALRSRYPAIHFQIYSGNSDAVTTRLDRGLLDFGVLLQPADLSKYRFADLPEKDVWGLLTRADSALARKESLSPGDLRGEPLILSQQVLRQTDTPNHIAGWFGDIFPHLDVVATYNLAYNATLMAESGMGHVLMRKGLVGAPEQRNLRFVPLNPPLSTGLSIVWKKQQNFSPAAEAFLEEIRVRGAASSEQLSSHTLNA